MSNFPPKLLGAYSYGILRSKRVREILTLKGWRLVDARLHRRLDALTGWAWRPSTARPRARAAREQLPFVALEDGFLRSIDLGLRGEPPASLLIDEVGVYYAADKPSKLEELLLSQGWETPQLLKRARAGMAFLLSQKISKYNASPEFSPDLPAPGYVLVIDQTAGDASLEYGRAGPSSFQEMLIAAQDENPGARIVIKTHPDVAAGLKQGHYAPGETGGARLYGADVNPWTLIEGAQKVYAATSQMGFEALIAGKTVRVFGAPFYSGWGATQDALSQPRRTRKRTAEELFAAAYLLYPTYFDVFSGRLTDFETVAEQLALRKQRNDENRRPTHCAQVTLWKRRSAQAFFGSTASKPRFHASPQAAIKAAQRDGGRVAAWSSRVADGVAAQAAKAKVPLQKIEDGFLRSIGLGQDLRLPASLAIDGSGVYYDPTGPSDLETLIQHGPFTPKLLERAAKLREKIVAAAITKYTPLKETPAARLHAQGCQIVLVVGQVEDDASIQKGAAQIRTNADLLKAARASRPEAYLVYRPHPDVEAGYRVGAVKDANALADHVESVAAAPGLLNAADEIWTMTSLMGFEALLRHKRVVAAGWPFYAGWGLTQDIGAPPPGLLERRSRPAALDELVAAAYLLYPRYVDPVTGLHCSAEIVLERLMQGDPRIWRHPNPAIRLFALLRRHALRLARG